MSRKLGARSWLCPMILLLIQMIALPTLAAGDTDPCLQNQPLNFKEREQAFQVTAQFSHLTYQMDSHISRDQAIQIEGQVQNIVKQTVAQIKDPRVQEEILNQEMQIELRVLVAQTIGSDSQEYRDFDAAEKTAAMGDIDMRLVKKATAELQRKFQSFYADTSLDTLAAGVGQDQALALLSRVSQDLRSEMGISEQAIDDDVSLYGDSAVAVAGASVLIGSLYFAAPIVASATAVASTTGTILAGCGLGAAGGAAAVLIQQKYNDFTEAYLVSERNGTSFSCELRHQLDDNSQGSFEQMMLGLSLGGVAGCGFVAASLVAPQLTAYTVRTAVLLATLDQATEGANDLLQYARAKSIYRSLQALQSADGSAQAGELDLAQSQLAQAQEYAREAGAHALNAIITGMVLVGPKAELSHAIAKGRMAIAALVSKSSDNTAIAVKQLSDSISKYLSASGAATSLTAQSFAN